MEYVDQTELFAINTVTGEMKARKMFDCEEKDRHAVSYRFFKKKIAIFF